MSTAFDDLEGNIEAVIPVKEIKRTVAKKAEDTVKKVTIILEENDNIPPTGQFFQINEEAIIIKPGEKVTIPAKFLNLLNDMVMSTPIVDGSNTVIGYRDRLRLPYRIVSA